MAPLSLPPNLKFGPFPITSTQAFHISPTRLSYGLVNLKPLLSGHVLVCPVRCVARLTQLTGPETADLFTTVTRITRTLERVYAADAFNVAVQDGVEAGQSVPHVHVHIIPRVRGDMDQRGGGDAVYELLEGREGNIGRAWADMQRRREFLEAKSGSAFEKAERVPRSNEVMEKEARWLREEMERDEDESAS